MSDGRRHRGPVVPVMTQLRPRHPDPHHFLLFDTEDGRLKRHRKRRPPKALLLHTIRGETAAEDLHHPIEAGVCTKEEAAAVAGRPEPFASVLGWVVCIAQGLRARHRLLTDAQAHLLGTLLVDLRAHCAAALLLADTQPPYPSVQLLAFIAHAYLLQLLAVGGGVVGLGLETGDYASVAMGYSAVVFSACAYVGLLSLHAVLARPFGGGPWDLPVESYQAPPLPPARASRCVCV